MEIFAGPLVAMVCASFDHLSGLRGNCELDDGSVAALAASLPTRLVGREMRFFAEVPSTNDIVRQLALEGTGDGTVVIAGRQLSGRGRRNRSWHSPHGGIWASVLLRPDEWNHEPALLTLLSSAAAARAIAMATGLEVTIKWPNDLRRRGRKLGGILGEVERLAGRRTLILGIGINANILPADFPLTLRDKVTSLMVERGHPVDLGELLKYLLVQLDDLYFDFRRGDWQPWLEDYRRRCETIGKVITVATVTGEVTGIAEEIDSDGVLILRAANGACERIVAGDVL